MFVVKYKKIFYSISAILVVGSIFSILFWGLRPSIDFVGGSLINVSFNENKPSVTEVKQVLNKLDFKDTSIRTSGGGFILRLKEISPAEKDTILTALSLGGKYSPVEKTFSSIGPILGKEALQKSWISIFLVLLAIVLFVAFVFRKVSKPISSWVYGLVTILALSHDVLIPTGIFALLGHFYGFEVDSFCNRFACDTRFLGS